MKNQKTIIIAIIAVALVAIVAYFVFFRKPKATNQTVADQAAPSSGSSFSIKWPFGGNKETEQTASTEITPPPSDWLSGFDDGERVIHQGHTWEAMGGSWAFIS